MEQTTEAAQKEAGSVVTLQLHRPAGCSSQYNCDQRADAPRQRDGSIALNSSALP